MLTNIKIRNFKMLGDVEFELGKTVVLIGPNNSGKTTALQAIALWEIGVKKWSEKRLGTTRAPEKRPGVTINRRDLVSIPVPSANLLWRDLRVRNVTRVNGKQRTENIRIDLMVDGVSDGKNWSCGLEFDYANEESLFCRPLRIENSKVPKRMQVPKAASRTNIAYLPPMSGLAAMETKVEPGKIGVLLGEGQTSQVLRNICLQISENADSSSDWDDLTNHIDELFGVRLLPPKYIRERGEITMAYKERGLRELDISSAGTGLQQTLLLLAYLYANPRSVLLLDEPDAHLEVLRQRQTYQLISEVAESRDSQIIAASHSEVVLNEAADRDIVISFVGRPHRIDDRGSQVRKALTSIGFEQFSMAEQVGWVLYLEGSTDLAILRAFAKTLSHSAYDQLQKPFVRYVADNPQLAREHFFALKDAYPSLVGIAIFDRLESVRLKDHPDLKETAWLRRELENYLCMEDVLIEYAHWRLDPYDLLETGIGHEREKVMKGCITQINEALEKLGKPQPTTSQDIKASDDFLDPLFDLYFKTIELPNMLRKSGYHILAGLVPADSIDADIVDKLDAIVKVAQAAKHV